MRRPGAVDYTMLCVLAAIWGGSFMLIRIAVVEVPPVMTTALRQGIAVVVLLAIAVSADEWLRASRSDQMVIILSAFFGMALPFSLISWGMQVLTAGFAAILMGLMLLITIVLAHLTTHDEKMNVQKLLGVVFGILGLAVLFWPDLVGGSDRQFWRQMAVMGAGVSYAINALLTKWLLHLRPRPMFAANIVWSLVMLVPVALLTESLPVQFPSASASVAILLLGVLQTAVASLVMFRIIGWQGASSFGQINLLVPWPACYGAPPFSANGFRRTHLSRWRSSYPVSRSHAWAPERTVHSRNIPHECTASADRIGLFHRQ